MNYDNSMPFYGNEMTVGQKRSYIRKVKMAVEIKRLSYLCADDVADELHVSRGTVYNICSQFSIKLTHKKLARKHNKAESGSENKTVPKWVEFINNYQKK